MDKKTVYEIKAILGILFASTIAIIVRVQTNAWYDYTFISLTMLVMLTYTFKNAMLYFNTRPDLFRDALRRHHETEDNLLQLNRELTNSLISIQAYNIEESIEQLRDSAENGKWDEYVMLGKEVIQRFRGLNTKVQ